MKTPVRSFCACGILPVLFGLLGLLRPEAVHAQATKIFVASTGNDANDGSRGNPKRTFQMAHDAVAAGGQIIVLDTSGYGPLNITKSLAVTVPPGVNGFITTSGSSTAVTINAASTDVVVLRGLILEGGGASVNGSLGISAPTVGTLTVQDCTVRGFQSGVSCFAAVNEVINVFNCDLHNCGEGIFLVNKFGTGQAATAITASVVGCRFWGNAFSGINTLGQNGSVDVTLADCVITGNLFGLRSQTLGGSNTCVVRVDNCRITGNGTGISTTNTGQVLSRGNNTLEKNPQGNTFPGTYSAK